MAYTDILQIQWRTQIYYRYSGVHRYITDTVAYTDILQIQWRTQIYYRCSGKFLNINRRYVTLYIYIYMTFEVELNIMKKCVFIIYVIIHTIFYKINLKKYKFKIKMIFWDLNDLWGHTLFYKNLRLLNVSIHRNFYHFYYKS